MWFPFFNLLAKNLFCRAISDIKRNQISRSKFKVRGMTTSQYHTTEFLHCMSESVRFFVDYMEH